jgi:hypothetical protein
VRDRVSVGHDTLDEHPTAAQVSRALRWDMSPPAGEERRDSHLTGGLLIDRAATPYQQQSWATQLEVETADLITEIAGGHE